MTEKKLSVLCPSPAHLRFFELFECYIISPVYNGFIETAALRLADLQTNLVSIR